MLNSRFKTMVAALVFCSPRYMYRTHQSTSWYWIALHSFQKKKDCNRVRAVEWSRRRAPVLLASSHLPEHCASLSYQATHTHQSQYHRGCFTSGKKGRPEGVRISLSDLLLHTCPASQQNFWGQQRILDILKIIFLIHMLITILRSSISTKSADSSTSLTTPSFFITWVLKLAPPSGVVLVFSMHYLK